VRSIYFSFHYEDIWRVNQIRNSGVVFGARPAGFADRSLWEEAKAKNAKVLTKLIQDGLSGTSVTAVLIGQQTASRRWVTYEISESIKRGNALIGIHINAVLDRSGGTTRKGAVPQLLREHLAPIVDWVNVKEFSAAVEAAWQARNAKPGILARLGRTLGL